VLSVKPGKRRRSSAAADNSPACWKAARIAAASSSLTENIGRAWRTRAVAGKRDRQATTKPQAGDSMGRHQAWQAPMTALPYV
jgi:hypothetical protein